MICFPYYGNLSQIPSKSPVFVKPERHGEKKLVSDTWRLIWNGLHAYRHSDLPFAMK